MTINLSNPSEVAREALRQLATRRIPPTPDNYGRMYAQISGGKDGTVEAFPERQMKTLVAALPTATPAQDRLVGQIGRAQQQKNWAEVVKALVDFAGNDRSPEWRELLPNLLRQWESRHAGLTPARKRELIEHVLESSEDPDNLLTRLKSLVRTWSQTPLNATRDLVDAAADDGAAADAPGLVGELRQIIAFTLDNIVGALIADSPELGAQAAALATRIRGADDAAILAALLPELKRFAFRLELLAEDRAELHAGLLHLLQLLIENIGELVVDDRWLQGQVDVVRDIVGRPLSLQGIDDAERRLKEVIFKQGQLKHSLGEAQQALKELLAGFVDHLATFSESTSDYQDKIERCAEKISKAEDISQLESAIEDLMHETRIIRLNAQRSRDDLRAAQLKVAETEKRIAELQLELDHTSELIRHDQMTGALNRRGLEEVFDKEINRANRRQTPLCLAVLDLDDFKKLNDTHGHLAGDAALIHLTRIIRGTLRPQDSVARYGGEEFIVLMPDTELESARKAMVRVQRALTKEFFMHENQKLLITFSAGVTQLPAGEDRTAAIKRADELMYHAKKTGKNKVVAA